MTTHLKRGIFTLCVTLFMLAGVLAKPAQAQNILYTFSGIGAGDLNGADFGATDFLVRIFADTSNIAEVLPDVFAVQNLTGTIDIPGVGVLSFTEPLFVFNNQDAQTVGFGNPTDLDLIDLTVPGVGLDAYQLNTAFGPITDPTPFFAQFEDVGTSGGPLTFTSMRDGTFTATLVNQDVPEPGTMGLLISAGLSASFVARRRVRRT
jgi:hypothetical protein